MSRRRKKPANRWSRYGWVRDSKPQDSLIPVPTREVRETVLAQTVVTQHPTVPTVEEVELARSARAKAVLAYKHRTGKTLAEAVAALDGFRWARCAACGGTGKILALPEED